MSRHRNLTLYDVLGISPDATEAQLKAHYRMLCTSLHPDTKPEAERASAGRIFAQITAAYEVLGDPGRRREYDAELAAAVTQEDLQRLGAALEATGDALRRGGFRQRIKAFGSLAMDPTIEKIGGKIEAVLRRVIPEK